LKHLPPQIKTRTVHETSGRGKQKTVKERREAFRADSIVRPLIAENLALGRPWYSGFIRLLTRINPATGKPFREQLTYEREGLHAMISDEGMWDSAGEAILVHAVHEAMRSRYGRIADENKGNPVAMRNRFGSEYDRWRLAFAGAKTADQFRKALCDLFSRAGNNSVLQESWQHLLPMLRSSSWQHARDLALLGLCSYRGRSEAESAANDTKPST
jgi:CRISPR-associated protein Cas8a1/Csx13